ncbi:hypothetical protein LP414_27850 [Polaromonas sp. P1(28)-13]|nr:hypothetical protein LP414_27850 [Polaromonas sp. P1(28)-13]
MRRCTSFRNSEGITYNGFPYEPILFDIEIKQESGTQGGVSLTINDYTKAIQARMQAYGGGVGFLATIIVVNAGALDQPPEIVEEFEVIGASSANYIVTFELGVENALAKTFPRRRQTRDFCQWRYKEGSTCGYTGGLPTCDLTLRGPNGCAAHSNTLRFGAYPGINSNGARYG